ncbi:unnamed protein product, partial [Closterium sp. Naga37s-1]
GAAAPGAAGGAAGAGTTAAGAAGGTAGASGGAAGAGAAGAAGGTARAAGGAAGTGAAAGAGAVGAAGGAAGAGAAGVAGGAAGTGDPGAEGTGPVSAVSGGTARPRPYYVPLLQQVLGSPPSRGPPPPSLSPPPVPSQSQLQPASPLPGPSPYSGPTRGLTELREPESRPVSRESRSASPVRSVCAGRISRPRPPPVPGTHSMTLLPSTDPQRVPLPSPTASSLPAGPDPASDSLRAASPAVTRFLATAVTDPLFESTAASALVTELVDFAAACRLDYATSLVAEFASASVCPSSVGGEWALGTDVLEDRQEKFECFAASVPHLVSMLIAPEGDPDAPDIPTPRSYAEAIEGPYSSQWQAAMDAEMASWKSTGTYVDEVPPPGANIVSGMWIFRVKRPPGSPPVFKARYVAPAQRDYELHSLDFSTAFLQGSLHEEFWLRRPPGFTGSFPADDLLFATADTEALAHVKSELQKRHTCTDLGHSLSAPPSDESVEPSGPCGLTAIAEAERHAPPEEGMLTMDLEIATRNIYSTEKHPLTGPASRHLQGILRGTTVGTFDAEGTSRPYTKEAFLKVYPHWRDPDPKKKLMIVQEEELARREAEQLRQPSLAWSGWGAEEESASNEGGWGSASGWGASDTGGWGAATGGTLVEPGQTQAADGAPRGSHPGSTASQTSNALSTERGQPARPGVLRRGGVAVVQLRDRAEGVVILGRGKPTEQRA